ncbi:MAG: hypothetical protein L0206_04330, partial [Actinobacteria bacterium]|nr:hypothetical protein [Actinomycetota bacterium]
MRRRPLLLPAAAALLLAASSVRAEQIPAERAALAWQTENADLVAVAAVESETRPSDGVAEVTLRVEDPIRGTLAAGARVVVRWSDVGHGTPWTVGGTCLAFLDALPREDEAPLRYVSVSGVYGLRMLPASGP